MIWKKNESLSVLQPLLASMKYLEEVLFTRLNLVFDKKTKYKNISEIPRPTYNGVPSLFVDFLEEHQLSREELIVLMIALVPHVQPNFFDQMITQTMPESGDFPEIGGVRGKQHRGYLPTGETVLFVLAGLDMQRRFAVQALFSQEHLFAKKNILWLQDPKEDEPAASGKLILNQDYVSLFTLENIPQPSFSMNFPAKRVSTKMEWEDLILNSKTVAQIRELETWLHHGNTLMHDWGMSKRVKSGYRVLFYGAPGTGKTLTAGLLGKYTGRDVYKVDLSMVVSKFIGETEKNLARLFSRAENKGWILFFDEADSLFGKRTSVRDAHDRYANQEVSYLLQRVEDYDGLVILASNFKSNIDEAFMRRFQSVIHFPTPSSGERFELWKRAFPGIITLDAGVDLLSISRKYEVTGANIINVVQYVCLKALERGDKVILVNDLIDGINREFNKEGRLSS